MISCRTLSVQISENTHTHTHSLSHTHTHTHTLTHIIFTHSLTRTLRKPTKGIQYLVESRVLDDDPHSVADFLTESTKNKLSKQKIGEFLGEINSDFNMAVLG